MIARLLMGLATRQKPLQMVLLVKMRTQMRTEPRRKGLKASQKTVKLELPVPLRKRLRRLRSLRKRAEARVRATQVHIMHVLVSLRVVRMRRRMRLPSIRYRDAQEGRSLIS